MSTPTVFLSAASVDLKDWREVLDGAFRRGGFRVLTQDQSLGSAPGDVKRLLSETIDECQCIVHLAGMGYGSDATDPFPEALGFQCSWTQFEYYLGHQRGEDVIGFVCSPDLSKKGWTESGVDAADIARKARLQQEHRQRVSSGKFDGTPLEGLPRTSNEGVDSVGALLKAVAAAVGTLHRVDQEVTARTRVELDSIAAALAQQDRELKRLRPMQIISLLSLLVLLVAGFYFAWREWGHSTWLQQVVAGQKYDAPSLRAKLTEASERKRDEDLTAARSEQKSADRQRLSEAAEADHQARLLRIADLAMRLAELSAGTGANAASPVLLEMTRILGGEGAEAALAYIETQRHGLIQERRAARALEKQRTQHKLQPLLQAAGLQASTGDAAAARTRYQELLESEPDWPEALQRYAYFLYDQSMQAETRGNLPAALAEAKLCQTHANRLLALDSEAPNAQRLQSAALNQLGDLAVAQGDLAGALRCFTESKDIFHHLGASDPANAERQRDLSISLSRLGDLAVAQGDPAGALRYFTESKDIRHHLAAIAPANAAWQRDVSVSLNKLGELAVAQGDLAGALRYFTEAKAIAERLAAIAPANAGWQFDLGISNERLGDLAVQQGKLDDALVFHTKRKDIISALAAIDPANAVWQRDLWVSYTKLADLSEQSHQPDEAGRWWRRAYDSFAAMKQRGLHISPQDEGFFEHLARKVNE